MLPQQTEILKPTLRVSPGDVRWYFIADYYDGPIAGLAFFRQRIHRFCCFQEDIPDQHIYVLHELTPEELQEELRVKERFEEFVGTHWSFDENGEALPRMMRPTDSHAQFYDAERDSLSNPSPDACDRPIVAWFDLRTDQ